MNQKKCHEEENPRGIDPNKSFLAASILFTLVWEGEIRAMAQLVDKQFLAN